MDVPFRVTLLFFLAALTGCAAPRGAAVETAVAGSPSRQGYAVLLRTIEALGGWKSWENIETMEFGLTATLNTPEGPVDATARIYFRMPDEMFRSNHLEGVGEIDMLVRGGRVWFKPADQDSLSRGNAEVTEYILAGMWRDLPFLLATVARGSSDGLDVRLVRDEELDGEAYHVLEVRPPDDLPGYSLYIHQASGLPLKRVFTQGAAQVEDVFSEFRREGAFVLPGKIHSLQGGEVAERILFTSMGINQPLDEEVFEIDGIAASPFIPDERAGVERAVLDYVEALYEVDPAAIERSVHPKLAKRGFWRASDSNAYEELEMSYEELHALAGRWNQEGGVDPEEAVKEIVVFDVLDQTATAKLTADWGVDFPASGQVRWTVADHPCALAEPSAGARTLRALVLLMAGLLSHPLVLSAQNTSGDRWDDVRRVIRQTMAEQNIASIAVAVARDGRIVWEEGFGWPDRERQVPATTETMYSVASITKPITATAVMRLVEQGKVRLDCPSNDYLGSAKIHSREWDPSGATVRRVLSHTAGLPRHVEFFYEGEAHDRRTSDEAIARYGFLVAPPGDVYLYSNLGYGVLERVIERVSGRGYAEYMREEIFVPLEMTRTAVSTGAGLSNAATRYDSTGEPIPPYDFDHRGASAVFASAGDLVRFGTLHLNDRAEGQQPILREETIDLMQQIATPGSMDSGYGMGWGIGSDRGHPRISHIGGMPGVTALLNLYPESGVVIVVLTNSSGLIGSITAAIAGVMLPGYADSLRAETVRGQAEQAAPVANGPGEVGGAWTGLVSTYEGDIHLAVVIEAEDHVQVRLGDRPTVPLESVSFRIGERRGLTGRFAGTIPTGDAMQHPHVVLLGLWLRENRLIGQATAFTPFEPDYFSLGSFVQLHRNHAGAGAEVSPEAGTARRIECALTRPSDWP